MRQYGGKIVTGTSLSRHEPAGDGVSAPGLAPVVLWGICRAGPDRAQPESAAGAWPTGPRSGNGYRICSATSTRSRALTFSIWLAIVATDDPAKRSPTATSSSVLMRDPESPGADMFVVTI